MVHTVGLNNTTNMPHAEVHRLIPVFGQKGKIVTYYWCFKWGNIIASNTKIHSFAIFAKTCVIQISCIPVSAQINTLCTADFSSTSSINFLSYKTFARSIFMIVSPAGLFTSISLLTFYTVYLIMLSAAVTSWLYPESVSPRGSTYPGCSTRINMLLDSTMLQRSASGEL